MNKKEYDEQYYKNNRERVLNRNKQWNKNNCEKMKNRLSNNPEHRRIQKFKIYGLSHEDWLTMWKNQDGKCAICGKPFITPSDSCIDHNHETGENRGLLCNKCNLGLGHFNDDIKLMKKAIEYLLASVLIPFQSELLE